MKKWVSILLAGGQSRRMGRSKACLKLEGKTIIEHLVCRVQPFSRQVIIVSNDQDEVFLKDLFASSAFVHVIKDDPRFKGEGPLAGIYTGMALEESERYFVGACDLANIDSTYLKGLHSLSFSHTVYDAYIPVSEGRIQPLAAVYGNHSELIESLLLQGKRRLHDLLQEIVAYSIPDKEWALWTDNDQPFFNMNVPEEYEEIIKRRGNNHD
jgi:molybdopterin-guanine dinucleotide biosynthesis protein A